ncbi:cerebellin-1-like [Saccostrea cucullata]|uniref:cerebellin-1-like n=1 Tax=Saccostrea cuccullata TaxID=36930 RepID=UPI002ED1CC0A
MSSSVILLGLSAILGNVLATEKASPQPSLNSFRNDYDSVAKTCLAVGFVKNDCKSNQVQDRRTRNMNIAFDAKAKGSDHTVSKGNTVMFGDVDLNIGGGYNAVKGIFTAPKSGVYVFDWTTMTLNNRYALTSLVLNGKRLTYNHCDTNSNIKMSCSKMAVVKMMTGDKAWIVSFYGTSSIHSKYSSFSGFMM